jgi:hypothetical protein
MNDGVVYRHSTRILLIFALAFTVGIIFVSLAEIQARAINLDLGKDDQDAYLT